MKLMILFEQKALAILTVVYVNKLKTYWDNVNLSW